MILLFDRNRFNRVYSLLRFIIVFSGVLFSCYSNGQVTTYPLADNARLQNFKINNPNYKHQAVVKQKFGSRDTLTLPFFDDFSESKLFPDSTRWLNNYVYINNQFPIEPPTFNVATFDGLGSDGRPYNLTINKDAIMSGDSLTSQPINLNDSMGSEYELSDSIILSFFYQPNGNGYHLASDDSLRLLFFSKTGVWVQVWSTGGRTDSKDFEHVMIPIRDTNFLHKGFQFTFTTLTKRVGNANHWHVDYVYLDSRRSLNLDYYNDYAVQTTPTSLLKNYTSMPYSHFLADASNQEADAQYFRASNLFNVGKNIEIRHRDSSNGLLLKETDFNQNSNNILAKSSSLRNLPNYSFTGLSGSDPIIINREVSIRENGIINDYTNNDVFSINQVFHDYYSYDDGSAERGFGFDQNTNPSDIEGRIATAFDITKEDTLYALATYFNEAVYDVSGRLFQYRVWSQLKGVDGATEDVILYSSETQSPTYNIANGERTFNTHYLDTSLLLSSGRYYIGWFQPNLYNLNVGWDMNHGNLKTEPTVSPNLYYNVLDQWSNTDLPEGTLMMRPHFGSRRELYASVHRVSRPIYKPTLFPNPARTVVHFGKKYEAVSLRSLNGNIVLEDSEADHLSIQGLEAGIYFVSLEDGDGNYYTSKLIILAP